MQCELTYLERTPIDLDEARRQHASYEALLGSLGWEIVRLPVLDDQPDAVFVEDAAIALEELAVVAPMGAASRTGETQSVAEALARYRPVLALEAPATLDGGDVLCIGRRVFVGLSRRTNAEAVEQLGRLLAPYEYQVTGVTVHGALHLKSACTYVGDETLLANTDWVDTKPFSRLDILRVDDAEEWGASVLFTGAEIVMPTGFPRTASMLDGRAYPVHQVELTEIRKAEGGPTCLSILLNADTR